MSFRINKTQSASPSMQVFFDKYVLKIWLTNRKDSRARALNYEAGVYNIVRKHILDKYPNAPFVDYESYGKHTSALILKNMRRTLGDKWRGAYGKWFYSALYYLYKNKAIPGRKKCINKFNTKIVENKYVFTILKNISLTFITTINCGDCCAYRDIVKTGNSSQIAWAVLNIINGIYHMRTLNLVHNDLHSNNILVEKSSSKFKIFDFDRAYVRGQKNPILSSDPHTRPCSSSQCNIYNDFPIDLYKMLRSTFTGSLVGENVVCELFDISPRNKVFIHQYFKRYGHFFCKEGSRKGSCAYTVLQYPNQDTENMIKLFGGDNIVQIQEKVRKNFILKFSGSYTALFKTSIKNLDKGASNGISDAEKMLLITKQKQEAQELAEILAINNRKLKKELSERVLTPESSEHKENSKYRESSEHNENSKYRESSEHNEKIPVLVINNKDTVVYDVTGIRSSNKLPKIDPNIPKDIHERLEKAVKQAVKEIKNTGFSFASNSATFGRTVIQPVSLPLPKVHSIVKKPDIRPVDSKIKTYTNVADIYQQNELQKIYPTEKSVPQYYKKNERGYNNVMYSYYYNTGFLAVFL